MIEVDHVEICRTDLRTRLPFKYGVATLTETPHAFVRVKLRMEGREAWGVAADHLPPKWFTKNAARPVDEEIAELEAVVAKAAEFARGLRVATVFDLWLTIDRQIESVRRDLGWPALLAHFGPSLVERAAIDAFCRLHATTFSSALREGSLGLRLEEVHPELLGQRVADLLPASPLKEVSVRHTVGLADPIDATDERGRIDDGLPETLAENIAAYGLSHFKVKFTGPADLPRLARVFATIASTAKGPLCLTLDGNESFPSVEAFRTMWASIEALPAWAVVREALWCVEQPFHRDIALSDETTSTLCAWTGRPPLIIDESDAACDSLRLALAGGYVGTSHKNCKGVFRGVANACLLEARRRKSPGSYFLQTGEDLSSIGPVALTQDLVVQATLGIESVERNGHHYFRGLSFLPEALQAQVLAAHPDLYRRHERGFVTLDVRAGRLKLRSVLAAPFGVGIAAEFTV